MSSALQFEVVRRKRNAHNKNSVFQGGISIIERNVNSTTNSVLQRVST